MNKFELPEEKHLVIKTRDFLRESVDRNKLQSLVQKFNEQVWPEMQAIQDAEPEIRGFNVKLGNTKILTWTCAGRVLINFQRGKNYLALCGDDDPKNGTQTGIQGVHATYPQMFEMLNDAVLYWAVNKQNYQPDKEVGLDISIKNP